MDFDLVIKGGIVIDGTGAPARVADVGIKEDIITRIDSNIPESNYHAIYAEGLIVAPGFIDIHSHSDFLWLVHPESKSKILDGVTTEICGNCGLSAFPLRGRVMERRSEGLAKYGIVPAWQTADEFFDMAEDARSSINRAFLAGHGNIRACVLGYQNKKPDSHDLCQMKEDLEEAMKSGAFGMSTGLIYPPGCYSTTDEIIEMCKVVEAFGGFYATHIRSEGDKLEEAIAEAIDISRRSNVSVQISHIKTAGKHNWHKIGNVKNLIERAIEKGIDITCDRYPYIAAATDLDVVLPHWVYEGGTDEEIRRLKDRVIRRRIAEEMSLIYDKEFWDDVLISSVCSKENKWMEGKSVADISRELDKTTLDLVFDLLVKEDTRVDIFLFSMSEENLENILRWDFVFIGSDSTVRAAEGILSEGKPHPRSYGTFSRVLGRLCREKGLLSMEKAIQKMTGLPAQKTGLDCRGFIKEGYVADITIFDPQIISDTSTFTRPHQYSAGIEYVIVNGRITVKSGQHTGVTNGRILRKCV